MRLTVGQATVRFLAAQYTSRDGERQRLISGCFGIFGHGNVAGLGQALLESSLGDPAAMPYWQGRNEQAMVHAAAAFARTRLRLSTLACTSSIGPGATNMVTGAALATINRLPVLLLPGDVFATRVAEPVLQQLEYPGGPDVTVNDAFRPVCRFFDRVWRPEMLPAALLGAMRVLTDPAETGAVCVALPQDVQAQAWDWPPSLFAERVWYVPRTVPDPSSVSRAASLLRSARRPLIVAGGGVLYSGACASLASFARAFGIPVAQTQAGKSTMRWDDPLCAGAIGATGTAAANALARDADVVVGIGTRWTDFTTASRTIFAAPGVRFISVNVATADASRLPGVAVTGDARAALEALTAALSGWAAPSGHAAAAAELRAAWQQTVSAAYQPPPSGQAPRTGPVQAAPSAHSPLPGQAETSPSLHSPLPGQAEVIGAVNEAARDTGIVLTAAGSMPGDLHRLWRTGDPGTYHVEYGYSCMGYEIAGGLGARMAAPDRDVFVLVGDGSYLMMSGELVTAVQEDIKLIVVCVDNHGFASIGNLSESVGAQRFGTSYRARSTDGRLDGGVLPIDLAANAASLGVDAVRVHTIVELREALAKAKASPHSTVIVIETDPSAAAPSTDAWWDVPVAEVATLDSTRTARTTYDQQKRNQRPLL